MATGSATTINNVNAARTPVARQESFRRAAILLKTTASTSAAANITLGLDIAGRRPDRAWLDSVIDAVGLRDRLGHRPHELSGGQQQRVAVARALAGRPDIVFADEPTGNLDSRTGAQLLDLLRRTVREFGQTVVMVTHDPVAASYADRILRGEKPANLPVEQAVKIELTLNLKAAKALRIEFPTELLVRADEVIE